MNEYDITTAFKVIENELIASMIRNMDHHRAEETKEGIEWSMWQVEQLKALEKYKRDNQKKYKKQFQKINGEIDLLIRQARETGNMQQEIKILEAIKKGFPVQKIGKGMTAEFFRLNDRKLEALIEATTHDMERAETAILRKAEDDYRKAIYNAQVYANTGAGTYGKAVDMATKDMLSRGLNCVQYINGARHTLADYADMAIRTASKRAYLQGEGEKRKEWGIATVIVNKRGNPCPKCLPFCGKVLIDDVWSGGSEDGVDPESGKKYPLMSYAISQGLYHPRCRDSHTTYFPGISTADDTWTKEELEAIGQEYEAEQKQQYAKRQEEKFSRLAEHSLDAENRKKYLLKKRLWRKAIGVFDTLREHEPISVSQLKSEYKTDLLDMLSQSDGRIQRIFLKHADKVAFINENAAGTGVTEKKGIRVNLKKDKNNSRGKYTTTFHEIGHCIDRAGGNLSYKTPDFKTALKSDFENVVNAYMKEYNVSQEEAYLLIGNALKADKYHAISDMAGGLTGNRCRGRYGHETGYWDRDNALEKEAFAHFFEAYARNDVEKIDILSQIFPSAREEFLKLLEG
jgi:hypothetical protein